MDEDINNNDNPIAPEDLNSSRKTVLSFIGEEADKDPAGDSGKGALKPAPKPMPEPMQEIPGGKEAVLSDKPKRKIAPKAKKAAKKSPGIPPAGKFRRKARPKEAARKKEDLTLISMIREQGETANPLSGTGGGPAAVSEKKAEIVKFSYPKERKNEAESKTSFEEYLKKGLGKPIFPGWGGKIKRSFYFAAVFVLAILLMYSGFCIFVLKTGADNGLLRAMERFFTVPALVSGEGVVGYYDYQDRLKGMSAAYPDEVMAAEMVKLDFAEEEILRGLAGKYMIDYEGVGREELKKRISDKMPFDHELNIVGLARIRKIKSLVKEGDFEAVGHKFGDETGKTLISRDEMDHSPLGSKLSYLKEGEISGIVIAPAGYFVFIRGGENDSGTEYGYIYVRAHSLDDFLKNSLNGYSFRSFVD